MSRFDLVFEESAGRRRRVRFERLDRRAGGRGRRPAGPARAGLRRVHALPRQAGLPADPGRGRARGDVPAFARDRYPPALRAGRRCPTRSSSSPCRGTCRSTPTGSTAPERLAEVLAAARRAQLPLPDRGGAAGRAGWSRSRGSSPDGEVTPIGVTDAVMHPNGISFLRFEYPSSVPGGPQRAMAEIAAPADAGAGVRRLAVQHRVLRRRRRRPRIVEVNGRMASQFAPLVRAVHGVSTYELGSSWPRGGRPTLPPARDRAWWPPASCCGLRGRRRPLGCPTRRRRLRALPGRPVELLVRVGQRLSENDDDTLPPPAGGDRAVRRQPPRARCWSATEAAADAPGVRPDAGRLRTRPSTRARAPA